MGGLRWRTHFTSPARTPARRCRRPHPPSLRPAITPRSRCPPRQRAPHHGRAAGAGGRRVPADVEQPAAELHGDAGAAGAAPCRGGAPVQQRGARPAGGGGAAGAGLPVHAGEGRGCLLPARAVYQAALPGTRGGWRRMQPRRAAAPRCAAHAWPGKLRLPLCVGICMHDCACRM